MVVFVPLLLGVFLSVYYWNFFGEVAERQGTAVGIITAHEERNHNQFRYTFSLNGRSYSGLGHPRRKDPQIGQQIVVYYDASNPSTNDLTDFAELSATSLGPGCFIVMVICGAAIYIFVERRKSRSLPIERTVV